MALNKLYNNLPQPNLDDPNKVQTAPTVATIPTVAQTIAPQTARVNSGNIQGPAVGTQYNTQALNQFRQNSVDPTLADKFANSSVGQGLANIGQGAYNTLIDTPATAIANTIVRAKDAVTGYNPYDGVGYQAPAQPVTPPATGALTKAANFSNPAPLNTSSSNNGISTLNMPKYDYSKFTPEGINVGNVAADARNFGGTIDLSGYNGQLAGNLDSNGDREAAFNGQVSNLMNALNQSKEDLDRHVSGIGSAGTFSGILQSKLLAKESAARRTQLQQALDSILQQRIGANDANRNNLQLKGLDATNAAATNAAEYSQSLGKNILNDAVQKDVNNNATQNDVSKLIANEQFSSDAKNRQFDLATKQRTEDARVALSKTIPGTPEYNAALRTYISTQGGTGAPTTQFEKVTTTNPEGGSFQDVVAITQNPLDGSYSTKNLTNQAKASKQQALVDSANTVLTSPKSSEEQKAQARAALKALISN